MSPTTNGGWGVTDIGIIELAKVGDGSGEEHKVDSGGFTWYAAELRLMDDTWLVADNAQIHFRDGTQLTMTDNVKVAVSHDVHFGVSATTGGILDISGNAELLTGRDINFYTASVANQSGGLVQTGTGGSFDVKDGSIYNLSGGELKVRNTITFVSADDYINFTTDSTGK